MSKQTLKSLFFMMIFGVFSMVMVWICKFLWLIYRPFKAMGNKGIDKFWTVQNEFFDSLSDENKALHNAMAVYILKKLGY
jgi:hypothetical protein